MKLVKIKIDLKWNKTSIQYGVNLGSRSQVYSISYLGYRSYFRDSTLRYKLRDSKC